ncbi:MAG: hypothetical protein KC731_12715 [Myxococcales bacterium]|nr:hypothetical protein [Myxococcales bacterium]
MVDPPPWPRGLAEHDVDQVLVVFSDVEMGAGGVTDDFPQTDYLGRLVTSYNRGAFASQQVTVVFNGDTFDLLKTSLDGAYPTRITAEVAAAKMTRVADCHAGFFEQIRAFLAHPDAPRDVCFITGNHDLELFFPEVQALIRERCGGAASFPGERLRVGDVQIEHGYQADPMFTLESGSPFIDIEGERLLNLPWGAVAVLEVVVPFAPLLYALDRMRPRGQVLKKLPEVRDLLLGAYWRYWTRDYWRDYFADADPMKKASWTMLREIAHRFGTGHADVSMGDHYQRLLEADDALSLYLIGHQHDAAWWSRGPRRVLRTGCFRNEFAFDEQGAGYRLLPKIYAEVFMQGGKVRRSHLVEVEAPPPPPGYLPESLFAVLPKVRELLAQHGIDVEHERAAQAAQEAKERESGDPNGFAFMRSLRRALLGKAAD